MAEKRSTKKSKKTLSKGKALPSVKTLSRGGSKVNYLKFSPREFSPLR